MKWYCEDCTKTRRSVTAQACPDCCGFRREVSDGDTAPTLKAVS